ncbi:MAG: glycosyltransferase [Candidatus Bipolaricaulota bacterium]|nr:glycosyltransferase [Candidatus Bipolaricaulota bacterium]
MLLAIALSNLWMLRRRLHAYSAMGRGPRVSILVPARNEQAHIRACIESLLAQEYSNFEVLVLDDQSDDDTARILQEYTHDRRLKVLRGTDPPPGWVGKSWACHQLAQHASGELLLFTDADTRHHPRTLSHAVSALEEEGLDFLSLFVKEEVGSWSERLVIPMIPWSILSFLPLALAYYTPWAAFSAANGQFLLFRRGAYDAIGGHEAVRQSAVEDLALARRVKQHGLRWKLLDGSELVRCRMYENYRQVYEGLTKNLLAAFDYRIGWFALIWLWIGVFTFEPLVVLGGHLLGIDLGESQPALGSVALSLGLWGMTYRRFGYPLSLALLYPASVALMLWLAWGSLMRTLNGRAIWKARTLPQVRWRWW